MPISRGNMKHFKNKQASFNKQSYRVSAIALAMSLTLPVAGNAYAEQAESEEIITVTASRSSNGLIEQLANQVVITQQDIENIQPKSMVDLLSTVAGIDISSQGGRGQNASLFLRGANANQTLFLVNGIRVGSATLGLTDFQTIPPEMIERVEIIKGPRAALWGSDAIGGVINILTKNLKSGEGYVGAVTGSDDYHQIKAGIGFAHGDGSSAFTFNREKSDGFDVLEGVQDDEDGYEYDTVAYRGQQNLSEEFAVDWMLQATEGETEYDNQWGADQRQVKQHVWYVKGAYDWTVGHVSNKLNVTLGQNRDYEKNFGNGVVKDLGGYFETRRDQFSVVNNSQVWPHFLVNFGADFHKEEVTSTTAFDLTERDVFGVFAQGLYQADKATFEFALRYDDIEHVDSEITYNAGVAFQLAADHKLTLNIGTGFNAPTFNDLYWPADPFSSGNADLTPEYSQSVELIWAGKFDDVDFSVSTYRSNIEDMIDWRPDENFFYQPVNVNEVDIEGVELLVSYQGLGGQHSVNASYTDTEDKATGQQLAKRAREKVGYQFATSIYDLDLFFDYQFHGKRTEGAETLSSFHLINVTANYQITPSLSTQLKVTNALDEEYRTSVNYNTQDRGVYFGLTYSL